MVGFIGIAKTPWLIFELSCGRILAVFSLGTRNNDGNVVARGLAIGKTKTPKSVRTILIPDVAVEALREWQGYCEQNNIYSEFVLLCTKTGNMRSYTGLRSIAF